MKKTIGIYMLTCTVNNYRYVGQSRNIERRMVQHKFHSTNEKMQKDVDLYGFDSFKLEILEECSIEELSTKEQEYIDLIKPEYNMLLNGFVNTPTEETRKKLSEVQLGHPVSEATRKKISQSHMGKTVSNETREKIRKAKIVFS